MSYEITDLTNGAREYFVQVAAGIRGIGIRGLVGGFGCHPVRCPDAPEVANESSNGDEKLTVSWTYAGGERRIAGNRVPRGVVLRRRDTRRRERDRL